MKKSMQKIVLSIVALTFLSGCASYKAASLSRLDSEGIHTTSGEVSQEIIVKAKAYTKQDCYEFLDRNVLSEGYQPVQLYIHNTSDKNYWFSLDRVGLASTPSNKVAETVHTSTMGRVLAYGIPGLFFWPFLIPAIVDGVDSSNANRALDQDFMAKAAQNQQIPAHSYFNKVIFVPKSDFQRSFTVTLIDQKTEEDKVLNVTAH